MEPFRAPFFGQPETQTPYDPGPISLSTPSSLCLSNAVNASNIALGVGLMIGSILSYAPQVRSHKHRWSLSVGTFCLTTCSPLSAVLLDLEEENH